MAAYISWRNFADDATLSMTEGTVDPAHPLANLKQRGLATACKSQSATSVAIVADMASAYQGVLDATFAPGITSGTVHAVVPIEPLTAIFGDFAAVGGKSRANVALLASDGSPVNKWVNGTNGIVRCAAKTSGSKVIIGGDFTTASGLARSYLAQLDPGRDVTAFDPGANGTVRALAVSADRKSVFCGGDFTTIGGTTRNRLARLNADGSLDSGWNLAMNGAVYALAMQDDGKLLVGGAFTTAGVINSRPGRVARLNADGSIDTWASSLGSANGNVLAVASCADGKTVIAGEFTSIGGTTRNRLARLNADGSLDSGWNPNANGTVRQVMVRKDGSIIIAGDFTSIGGTTRNRLARLNADGSLDSRWNPNANGVVHSLAMQDDGELLVGGAFTTIGGASALRSAKLSLDAPDAIHVVAVLGITSDSGSVTIDHRAGDTGTWTMLAVADLRSQANDYLPKSVIVAIQDGIPAASQVRVSFTSMASLHHGAARLWAGPALTLPQGVDAGWSMTFRDSGSLDVSAGQQWYASTGVRTRALTIPLEGAQETRTAWGFDDGDETTTSAMSLHALQLEAGTTGEVIAIARTDTQLWTRRTAIYGHIEQPWSIAHKAGPYWGSTITVVEER